MKEKLKGFFTTNIGWKIVALLGGIVLYVIVMNIQNPTTTIAVNVPVDYINQDLLRVNDRKVFLSGPEIVPITVTVRTSQMAEVFSSDFTCKADLTMRSGGDLANQSVRIEVEQVGGQGIILGWDYQRNDPYVTVALDEYVSKEFPVEMIWNDDVEELKPEEVTFSPATIIVSGPSSRFTNVARAVIPMTLSDLTQGEGGEFNRSVSVKLYDLNGKEISGTEVFDFDHKSVQMSAKIANMKTVRVKYDGQPSGVPADTHFLSGVEAPTGKVTVLSLSHIDLQEISIPLSVLDITGINADKVYSIDLMKYLPQGIYLSESERWVSVKVELTAYEVRTINFTSIGFDGENQEYIYQIKNTPSVTVKGTWDAVKDLTQEAFQPRISVAGLEPGNHTARVIYQTPENVQVIDQSLTAEVDIQEVEPSTESEAEESQTDSETETETESQGETV